MYWISNLEYLKRTTFMQEKGYYMCHGNGIFLKGGGGREGGGLYFCRCFEPTLMMVIEQPRLTNHSALQQSGEHRKGADRRREDRKGAAR